VKIDSPGDPQAPTIAHVEHAIGCIINWQNERYREFGLWKRWPAHNIHFQKLRMEAGEITPAEFSELCEMFWAAAREPLPPRQPRP
jgi:hypothetical protein